MVGPHQRSYLHRRPRCFGGPVLAGPPKVVLVGMTLLFAAFFHFWPLVFWWMILFFLLPALAFFVREIAGRVERRPSQSTVVSENRKEKELLKTLECHAEITPALAALETSLSISEAERILDELAKNGHIEVRAHEGKLVYALWDRDRRELTD